jgi:hypothetical protein
MFKICIPVFNFDKQTLCLSLNTGCMYFSKSVVNPTDCYPKGAGFFFPGNGYIFSSCKKGMSGKPNLEKYQNMSIKLEKGRH